ncbi:MAG TPA: hypothetical protein VKA64_04990 [Gammaproteobacteria bacterium]|nr:hypothetical protein [Gammaproteobacteria bacterium]
MARYCQKIDDGYIYPYSETLAERGDFRVIKADPRSVIGGRLVGEQSSSPQVESEPPEPEGPSQSTTPLGDMTKDMLEAFARKQFGAELDKRYRKDTLIRQVEAMQQGMTPQEALQITD